MYEAMEGNPVTIRFWIRRRMNLFLLKKKDIELLAKTQGKSVADIKAIIASLHEFNPMMGHRGCRLAVTYPEIAAMQTRAVIKAALNVKKAHPDWGYRSGNHDSVSRRNKRACLCKEHCCKKQRMKLSRQQRKLTYKVGTMIEIPRLALTADEIAKEAEFFSFGTNDLTQMTYKLVYLRRTWWEILLLLSSVQSWFELCFLFSVPCSDCSFGQPQATIKESK